MGESRRRKDAGYVPPLAVPTTPTGPTPPPWKYDLNGQIIYAEDPYGKGYMHIADVRGWGFLTGKGSGALGLSPDDGSKIQDANGELIASAPALKARVEELEEACKRLLVHLEIRNFPTSAELQDIEFARTALEKGKEDGGQ